MTVVVRVMQNWGASSLALPPGPSLTSALIPLDDDRKYAPETH
jgi:hypothetical protein